MTFHRLTLPISCLTTLTLTLAACDLGPKSIGNETDADADAGEADDSDDGGDEDAGPGDGDGTSNGFCGAETLTIIDDLDAALPDFSVTVAEILAIAEGTYLGEFDWLSESFVSTPYADNSSPLTTIVTYLGGEVRLTEVELAGQFPGGQEGGAPCAHRLEIDVILDFVTDDGLFTETWSVPLRHYSHESEALPGFYFALDMDAHQGSLALDDFTVSGMELRDLFIVSHFDNGQTSGGLMVEVGDMDVIGFGPVADFEASREP
jgi:hypothetical protein